MDLVELYNMAHELPEKLQFHNKYTWLIFNGIVEARYLDINDAITKNILIGSYIKSKGIILLFPSKVNGVITDIYVRALDSKETPLKLGPNKLPFGIGLLQDNFKYGSQLILVEGISDLGALKLMKPDINVISIQSNSISKDLAKFLSTITNHFIILFDNDSAGIKGSSISRWRLNDLDCNVNIVNQHGTLKDAGDVLDIISAYLKRPTQELKDKIELISEYYNFQLK